jgi:hypothetical protein
MVLKLRFLLALATLTLFVLVGCGGDDAAIPVEMQMGDFDFAAGNRNFQVALNGVILQINEVQVIAGDDAVVPGYVYVVPRILVTNQSDQLVAATEFMLVDEYLNLYESWQTNVSFGESLSAMPAVIRRGEATAGDHVFIVPASALRANLKMRWESSNHQSRIEITLGDLAAGQ